MSKDTCIKANTYCPVHKGIVGADCWHDSKDFSVPRTDWKQVDEINTLREQVKKLENRLNKDSQEFTILCAKETEKVLREQVEKLKAELKSIDGALNDPRANLTLTTSEIIWGLKEQVKKLTKERDSLTSTLEHMEHTRDVEQTKHRDMSAALREQLAALAEQNEKYREALQKLACLGNGEQYGNSIGNCIAQEALSLPGLASPVLNRIRADGVRKASTLVSLVRNDWASAGDNLSVQAAEYLISALDTRATELEKTNG